MTLIIEILDHSYIMKHQANQESEGFSNIVGYAGGVRALALTPRDEL